MSKPQDLVQGTGRTWLAMTVAVAAKASATPSTSRRLMSEAGHRTSNGV